MRKYKLSINGQTFNVEIISEQIDSYEVSVNGELIIVNKDSSQILNPTPQPKISQKIEIPKQNLNQEKNETESLPESTNAKIENNSISLSLNSKGQPLYLAVNCYSSRLNWKPINGKWNQWFAPTNNFEFDLLDDLCENTNEI